MTRITWVNGDARYATDHTDFVLSVGLAIWNSGWSELLPTSRRAWRGGGMLGRECGGSFGDCGGVAPGGSLSPRGRRFLFA
jgi:hypothetical protein